MKQKRRLIYALSGLVVTLSLMSVAVVFVLAAITQTIDSNVKVSYVSREVAGVVSATYKIGSGEEKTMKTGNGGTELVFRGETENSSGNELLPEGDIYLTASDSYVVFVYSFTNTGDTNYTANFSFPDDNEMNNIAVYYSRDNINYTTNNSGITVYNNTDSANAEKYYVKLQISNVAQNASFSGSFSWDLDSIPNETAVRVRNAAYATLETSFINSVTEQTIVSFVNNYTVTTTVINTNLIFTADQDVTITRRDGSTILVGKGQYLAASQILV